MIIPRETLELLRDIHAPDPVAWWPPAPGWWLLLGGMLLGGWWWRQRRGHPPPLPLRRDSPLPAALRELEGLARELDRPGQAVAWCAGLSSLLRRVAVEVHGRSRAAGLTGEEWLAFLDDTGGNGEFSRGVGRALITAPYRPEATVDRGALLDLARRWIRHQSPPTPPSTGTTA